ncbi:cation diffusion facilitator family transporter [Reyranella sp.]|jgi:cation diffusion facilitator family transporter|uniref:cation diffusion facilitator family transporter n=1 Tax=Reyranella sp. TaxID=1929291 RepID=UPI000BC6D0C0|nr:cation diffusion facilitator family transporter [Reyranella sp.]OYZ79248.1 MAG: cobalt transporter [Rhizobiales bacterium 24-66-13]OZB05629.1 MAG: cobalt transporter [Rhizobiales bacterium 39-66-18]HQT15666.1 cation diffusion facilitator family transporter [Reyranella sp.]
MLTAIKDWLGFGGRGIAHGHDHHGGAGGHGHTHGVIDPSLSSSERGIWAIKWSFVILAITAILQLIVVFMSGSVALLADTIHNIGDATTAIPLWIAFVLVRRKPTATFNYGLGRVEDLAGMVIVLIILFSAIVAAREAIDRLMNPQPITQLVAVAVAGVVGFIGNEAVAIFRIKVGREMNSAALIADGYHARTDGLTSLAVVLGAAGVWAGFPLADPIIGLLITIAIFGIVWQSARAVITRSLDGIEPGVTDEIRHAAEHVPGVRGVVDAKARWLGHKLRADVTIAVDRTLTVSDANVIVARLESELHAHITPLEAVTVQFDHSDAIVDLPIAEGGHHHAPEAFRVSTPLADGLLQIVDTPDGERMRLTLVRGIEGLDAIVKIDRPGGVVETLSLLPASKDHKVFQSTVAPDEPHEFDAQLLLSDNDGQEEVLPFRMEEPEGHHH